MNKTEEIAKTTLACACWRATRGSDRASRDRGFTRGSCEALYRDLHGRSAPSGQLPDRPAP